MLGAFQLGDIETMHKYYADNATFVSGSYAPPVVGWQNYVPIYQSGMAGFQGIQLIRRNTYIFNHGRRCLGHVSVGISFNLQRQAVFSGRADDADIQQGRGQMADRAQPHVASYAAALRPCSNRPHHNSPGRIPNPLHPRTPSLQRLLASAGWSRRSSVPARPTIRRSREEVAPEVANKRS